MTLSQKLVTFIQENLIREGASTAVSEHESLISRGLLDSIGLHELMVFLEQETGLRIPDDEVLAENFDSVATMEAMVRRLRARSGGAD
jgi:acyl carrier protein